MTNYVTIDSVQALNRMIARARAALYIAVDVQTIIEPDSPQKVDPLRSTLIAISIAIGIGEVYYLPLRHRTLRQTQNTLFLDDVPEAGTDSDEANEAEPKKPRAKSAPKSAEAVSIAARMLAEGVPPVKNLPPLNDPSMAPLRALLEDPAVQKVAQNAKYAVLVLRRAGITLGGLASDTMVASYVLDPGRRSHG